MDIHGLVRLQRSVRITALLKCSLNHGLAWGAGMQEAERTVL